MNNILENNSEIEFDIKSTQQSFNEGLKKQFEESLAKKPFCTDDLNYGLQIRAKESALLKKYIQGNTPFNFSWFCFDVDYPHVLETTFREKFLPAPNFMITNPVNLHCHLLYGIETKIHLSDNSSVDAIRYAHAVEYALRDALKADVGYSGLIVKNPINDYWITREINPHLWTLAQMSEFLILPHKVPAREMLIGLGRNCTLFDSSRNFAYSQVLNYRDKSSKENFYEAVLYFINEQNKLFRDPLPYNQFKAIAKSITNWTWRYYLNKTTKQWIAYVKRTHNVDIQSWRGKRNTAEQQSIKGKIGGANNTSEVQSIKGKIGGANNTSEVQAIKGKIGGANNTSEVQAIKGKIGGANNTSEVQSLKGIKSGEIRYEGSAEQLRPWENLNISRRTYYYRQKNNLL